MLTGPMSRLSFRLSPRWGERRTDSRFDCMFAAVVPEGNCLSRYLLSIERKQGRIGRIGGEPRDGDVVEGLPVAVTKFEGGPGFRHLGGQPQLIPLEVYAKQGFNEQSIHPTG